MPWQDKSVLHEGENTFLRKFALFQLMRRNPNVSRDHAWNRGIQALLNNAAYMDALSLPSANSMMSIKVRLQPTIRTLFEAFTSVPDGICWSSPYQNHALEAHVAFQVCSTTVRPILPSLLSCLHNLWKYAFVTLIFRHSPLYLFDSFLHNRSDYDSATARA
jgi:hypothetical protein